jgi:hypothetical protein
MGENHQSHFNLIVVSSMALPNLNVFFVFSANYQEIAWGDSASAKLFRNIGECTFCGWRSILMPPLSRRVSQPP